MGVVLFRSPDGRVPELRLCDVQGLAALRDENRDRPAKVFGLEPVEPGFLFGAVERFVDSLVVCLGFRVPEDVWAAWQRRHFPDRLDGAGGECHEGVVPGFPKREDRHSCVEIHMFSFQAHGLARAAPGLVDEDDELSDREGEVLQHSVQVLLGCPGAFFTHLL